MLLNNTYQSQTTKLIIKKNHFVLNTSFLSLSILSRQVEHNKWPFLFQNALVDLSISLLQIKHLKIGVIVIDFTFNKSAFKCQLILFKNSRFFLSIK